ncbi:MAG: carbon-nitrogen hydrolase family protein [Pseudomonadota bacterium]
MPIAAAIQMTSSHVVEDNLATAARLIEQAASQNAVFCVLPENFALMGQDEYTKVELREPDSQGPLQDFLAQQAAKHNIWVAGGTLPLIAEHPKKIRAACLLYNSQGERIARYDKMHMFDIDVPDNPAEQYRESNTIEAGQDIVVADTPIGKLGMSICYDLRFPELYRAMVRQGVTCFIAPSAFTVRTGLAHWDLLLRARAVENLCYMLAPGQVGSHTNGRETFGNSMIVDPWGKVEAHLPKGEGVVCANIDTIHLQEVRTHFPALSHSVLQ